jgi:hypothetical protein
VQKVNDRWFYRTPEFFTRTSNPGQWVGALVLAVQIR